MRHMFTLVFLFLFTFVGCAGLGAFRERKATGGATNSVSTIGTVISEVETTVDDEGNLFATFQFLTDDPDGRIIEVLWPVDNVKKLKKVKPGKRFTLRGTEERPLGVQHVRVTYLNPR